MSLSGIIHLQPWFSPDFTNMFWVFTMVGHCASHAAMVGANTIFMSSFMYAFAADSYESVHSWLWQCTITNVSQKHAESMRIIALSSYIASKSSTKCAKSPLFDNWLQHISTIMSFYSTNEKPNAWIINKCNFSCHEQRITSILGKLQCIIGDIHG
jgi:hypothetical protein